MSSFSNLLFIVGNYGSGKTEVAVNLAFQLKGSGRKVSIADLDLVNPYFRCRESREALRLSGIRVVVPPESHQFADLPIVVPEIKGMIAGGPEDSGVSIFDVGGDDVGATVLASLNEALSDNPYELFQVINAKRPFTDSVDGCVEMMRGIEQNSGMRVTHLISNTHLMDETTPEIVVEGYELTREVSRETGIPIAFVSVAERLAEETAIRNIDAPILSIERIMVPPWLQGQRKNDSPTSVGGLDDIDVVT